MADGPARMVGLLRAFAWLRWRLFLNSFKGTGRRDTLERVSRAASSIAPIIFTVLFIPGLIAFAGLSFAGGYILGGDGEYARVVLPVVRIFLAVITLMVVIAPIVRSVRRSDLSPTRFLLLPIPRALLHVLELAAGITDPWLALVVPVAVMFPAGLAAAGAIGAAAAALVAGIVLLVLLLSLESCVSHALALLYRNRRRGELASLIILVLLSLMGFLPALLGPHFEDDHPRERRLTRRGWESAPEEQAQGTQGTAESPRQEAKGAGGQEPAGAGGKQPPVAGDQANPNSGPASAGAAPGGGRAPASDAVTPKRSRSRDNSGHSISIPRFAPSEFYARAVRPGAGLVSSRAGSLLTLVLIAGALYGISWTIFSRLLDTPETGASRRSRASTRASVSGFPGLGPGASAVAFAYMKLSLRTIQGKMAVYYTPIGLLVAAVAMSRLTEGTLTQGFGAHSGPILATFAALLSLLSMQKLMLNQFAIEGAGLTLQFLSPLSGRDIVAGNSAGLGVFFVCSMLFYLGIAAIFAPDPAVPLWGAAVLAGLSTFLVYAPITSALSALFPKAIDPGRIGSASNPTSAASLLGTLGMVLSAAPPVLLGAIGLYALRSPALALLFVACWTCCSALLFVLLSRGAAGIVEARRENLAMVAEGR
jgi:hypothetical protein